MHGEMRIKNDMLSVLKEHFSMLYNETSCNLYEKYAISYGFLLEKSKHWF